MATMRAALVNKACHIHLKESKNLKPRSNKVNDTTMINEIASYQQSNEELIEPLQELVTIYGEHEQSGVRIHAGGEVSVTGFAKLRDIGRPYL